MSSEKEIYSNCLYYATNAFSRKINRIADEEFAATGLSSSYCFILMTVNSNPGATIGYIADTMQLAYSTVSRMIEKLENKGYVKRSAIGRYTEVYPAEKAVNMQKKLIESWQALFGKLSQLLGKEIQEELTIKIASANKILE